MSRRMLRAEAARKRFSALATLALTSALLSCSSTEQPTALEKLRPHADAQNVDAAPNEAKPPSSLLAQQAQRDVDDLNKILAARDAKRQAPNPETIEAAAAPPKRVVVWDDAKPKPSDQATIGAVTRLPDPAVDSIVAATQPQANADEIASTLNSATLSLEPDRLKQLMVDLTRELYAGGAYSEAPMRNMMLIAAMSMLDAEREINLDALHDLSDQERQLLAKLQEFFANLGQTAAGSNDLQQAVLESLDRFRGALIAQPELRLPHAALCTRVGGFGDYNGFERNSFLAHSEQKVIVYLEIDDFASELNPDGQYVTELSQQLTIYSDRDGIAVWGGEWQSATDLTKNKRQDFFTVQVVTLPKALSVGKYQLKIRARDEKSKAEAETTIEFEMVADPKMAASIR